ncbi:hypothetical protein PPTG_06493 [Phytophthora nicotianae INRA-310]|uniref:Uncharacterized protein n=1 Tax=Phytophthora nicotianae (strain INRA-310) TaxID=761204 RepID=W2QTC4_PHYN3|nr:hypothetical protein PPTG_06493 [Phytophthora nicotianae INRA-310]ETN16328.1 hypothetical protein PPTG_06493 [Phytophthora nicotianae INRA-310]
MTAGRAASCGRAHKSDRQLVLDQDVDATDTYGYTMLMFAARDGDVKKVRFLLENNASTDIRNGYGATALHFAASWGQRMIARLLLERGAYVNALDNSGKTPLMRAAANGDTKLVRVLLEHGAETSIRDAFGWNAERLAASAGHYKVFVTLQKHEHRRSTSSHGALRWSQRSSGVFSALNLRLSTTMKDAKPRSEVGTPFPASIDQLSNLPGSNGLLPLRTDPCHLQL